MSQSVFLRIDTVFLPVRNLDDAVEWYRARLEWPLAWREGPVACLQAGETPLTLLQHRHPGFEVAPANEEFAPVGQVCFNLYAPDIQAARQRLVAAGVEVSEVNDHGEVKDFHFRDPDGNPLGVCSWPEAWVA